MAEYTPFGFSVKTKLLGPPAYTQEWLCNATAKDTGLKVDSAYMSKILTGQRTPRKVILSICKILDLPEPTQDDLLARK